MSKRQALVVAALLGVAAACGPDPGPAGPPAVAEGIFAPLGEPFPFATEEQRATFARGLDVVRREFTVADGLGPEFNLVSCGGCHEKPAFGGSAGRYRDFYLSGSLLPDGSFITPPKGGIEHFYGVGEGNERPRLVGNWNVQARRNPLPVFGVGLIAELSEEVILANADPDDADGDGISGRPNFDNGFVGRFGRKAQTVSIEGFIRGPLNNHLGITSDPLTDELRRRLPVDSSSVEEALTQGLRNDPHGVIPKQAAPPSEPLFDEDDVPDPELSAQDLFDVVSYSMLLAVPSPAAPTEETTRGKATFGEIGCASCHIPALEGPRGLVPLYSDLLLHDMGPDMADGLEMGLASDAEFRTQPLWGIAAVAPYLHDGRADTLDEAIRWHGGEAQASRERYDALPAASRADLIAFLESLGGADQRSGGLLPPNAPVPDVGAVGGPARALDGAALEDFVAGRALFDHDFAYNAGLGPDFNGDSCRACHFAPSIGGAGPLDVNVMRHATFNPSGTYTAPAIGTILPKFSLFDLPRIEPTPAANVFEPRQTPHVFGLGAIESIAEVDIVANADPDDANGDGIRGRVHRLADGRLGRFGWKAQVPSIREFIRDAMGAELGITTPAEDGLTFGLRRDFDAGDDPELTGDQIDALEHYLVLLAPPPPARADAEGERLFAETGCASCHIPSLPGADGPVLLYSDLLLHDVAPEGRRGIPDGDASATEFRTPPLWGMGRTAPYMHNGAAATALDAIEAHDGTAAASRQAVRDLSAADRDTLLRFLASL